MNFFVQLHFDMKLISIQFLVFDRIKGVDLFQAMELRKFRPMPEEAVNLIISNVANSLQRCHDLQMAHRDVKLENVSTSIFY